MDKRLTEQGNNTRRNIYDFIVEFFIKNSYAPSVREICVGVGLKSTSSVYSHLMTLERERKIEVKDRSPRAIKVIGYEFTRKNGGISNG